jgi:outer membrane protein assembly factor BamA
MVALIFLLLLATSAQAQYRAELIERARDKKEETLTPERPPKAEQRFVGIQNSVPFRLLTGEIGGFGLGFGQIAPGAGVSIGPQYKRNDLLGGNLSLGVGARFSASQSYLGRFDLGLPRLLDGAAFVNLSLVHRNVSEMAYYGPGPDSEKSGRSNYRLEDTNLELRPGFRVFRKLRASAIGSYLAVNVGPGHATRYISSEQQFGPGVAPGIDRQSNFLRGGGAVEFDRRDRPSNPTSGGRYSAQYVRFLDRNATNSSFYKVDLDAAEYFSMFNGTKVLALHGATSLTDSGGGRVPFYLQPTLGGSETLRGYRAFRFYGDNSVMVNAEYRWELSPVVDMVAFVDAGKVFNRWSQLNLHSLESDVGFGFRFKYRSQVALALDTGFSHEGFQIWFRVNSLF